MKISVIIPTLNAEKEITELMICLKDQTRQAHEIIIVDSSSNDRTVHIAYEFGAKVIMVDRHSFDHGGTRNYAASHAIGDVLVFMTQDAIPDNEHFLKQLTQPLQDERVAATYGRQVAHPNASDLEKLTREFNYPPDSLRKSKDDLPRLGIKTFFLTNVCSSYRRSSFEQLGKFEEPIISNEDMIMAAKLINAGYLIAYAADAKVKHSHDYTAVQQFRRHFDIGVSLCLNKGIVQGVKAEGEGKKLIKLQLKLLKPIKMWYRIPGWIIQLVAKYAGYRLGLICMKLPKTLRSSFSMHKNFWNHYEG
ncbi:MAG: glycosyltransferase family 2 protein [Candidatus Cohnella colombiensis]|uniref:Glycosyltransferase family 2 protein n=1 Tax=Candidatus Cohnella colombiensis TaxID=3121368 RepID=A0AA95EXV5_9BACL|nr:MAG: glycosyltransferase family 2 protein [Cohnella sp.]